MDLTTSYLGLTLKNPLVASASPLTLDLGNIRRIEDAGGAALVPTVTLRRTDRAGGRHDGAVYQSRSCSLPKRSRIYRRRLAIV